MENNLNLIAFVIKIMVGIIRFFSVKIICWHTNKTIVNVGGCCKCLVKFRCFLVPVQNGHNKIRMRMKCSSYSLMLSKFYIWLKIPIYI